MSKTSKLPNFIASHLQGANIPPGATKEFCNLIKAIGESGTNHEETRIINKEAKILEGRLKEPGISNKQMKEYLVRLIYCEMLGKSVPFGYIHAVKFTQHSSLAEKRMGYLAVSLLLHADHELIVLLVNTIQRDLKSSNIVELCMSLISVTKLINAEMIPAVLQYVTPLLSHNREIIRKKAVLAIHRFYLQSPSSIAHLSPKIRRALFDQDPGVMTAALNLFYDMARDDPDKYKDLVPSFVSILKQVIENRLPREFSYHKVPAPWVQLKLLRIFALLGENDRTASEAMYEVVRDCLKRADVQSSAAYAIVYECAITCTKIYPSSQLVELAAKSVGRFLRTDNNNLKYLGITALAAIVSVNPAYAHAHKSLVIECLDDPDETLKRKTLDLLCKMTNPANVKVIVEKLLGYLKSTVDVYLRKDLVPRIIDLAERFAPDNLWYIETINTLFLTAGDLVEPEIAHSLMRLIAEGTDDDDQDAELRAYAAESYIDLLEEPSLPDILVQTIAWVVGEYAYVVEDTYDQEVVLQMMSELLDRTYTDDSGTKAWIISGITKLVSQTGLFPNIVRDKLTEWLSSASTDLQQRCAEVLALVQNGSLMRQVLPIDASCEDIEVDADLSFLDNVVSAALSQGALPYQAIEVRTHRDEEEIDTSHIESTFNFTPYEAPKDPDDVSYSRTLGDSSSTSRNATSSRSLTATTTASSTASGTQTPTSGANKQPPSSASVGLALQVKTRRWARGGDIAKKKAAEDDQLPPLAKESSVGNGSSSLVDIDGSTSLTGNSAETTTASLEQPQSTTGESKARSPSPSHAHAHALDTEKQQLADSLFATVETTGSTSPSTRRRGGKKSRAARRAGRTGNSSSARSRNAAPESQGDLLSLDDDMPSTTSSSSAHKSSTEAGSVTGDLMDLLGNGANTSTPDMLADSAIPDSAPPSYESVADSSQQQSSDDLLGGLFGDGPSSSPVTSTSTSLTPTADSSSSNNDLLLNLDSMYGSTSTDPPTSSSTSVPTTSAARGDDATNLMDLMSSLDVSNNSSTTTRAATVSSNANANASDGSESLLLPTSGTMSQSMSLEGDELAGDSRFVVTAQKHLQDAAVSVELRVYNKTNHVSSGVVLSLEMSRALQRVDASKMDTKFSMKIPAESMKSQVTEWVASSVTGAMNVKGDLAYTGDAGKRVTLRFKVPIAPSDFLRPLQLSTEEFGSFWQQHSSEQSTVIPSCSSCATVDAVSALARDRLRLHTVQVIGSEVILASKALFDSDQRVLVHLKLELPTIYVSVRCQQRALTDAVVDAVKSVFA